MSAFGMIESFFFLSLGVVFVLLMLLVYHFKQRITTIEQKSDTMFDIVQNLAKELTTLKGRLSLPAASCPLPSSKEDDGEDEDDDDEDEDEEHYENTDDDDDDDDDDDEDSDEEEERVKVIDIGTLKQIDPIRENDDYRQSDSDDESPVVELNDDESEKIKVLKVPPQLQDFTDSTAPTSADDSNMNVYKKMAVGDLRTTVISKGLCSDASKLNKVELLKMLSRK